MKKSFMLFVLVGIVFLNACTMGRPMGGRPIFNDDDYWADVQIAQVLSAISNNDKECLKAMFSKRALAEAYNFDKGIEYVFNLIEGNKISLERTGLSGESTMTDGRRSDVVRSIHRLITDKDEYMIIILAYRRDTFNPDNVGIYTLRIIRTEYRDTYFTTWSQMKIAGIFIPEFYVYE